MIEQKGRFYMITAPRPLRTVDRYHLSLKECDQIILKVTRFDHVALVRLGVP